MTANDLYGLEVEEKDTSYTVYRLVDAISVSEGLVDIDEDPIEKEKRILLKEVFYDNIDCERFALMETVWFDDKPVMIMQCAGRGGQDFQEEFITDIDTYRDMVEYIRSFEKRHYRYVIDPEKDIHELTNFYGYSLGVKK